MSEILDFEQLDMDICEAIGGMTEEDVKDMLSIGYAKWEVEEILVQGYHFSRSEAQSLINKV